MKAKKFDQKLTLNKTTVANLSPEALKQLRGGLTGICSDYHSECVVDVSLCGPGTLHTDPYQEDTCMLC